MKYESGFCLLATNDDEEGITEAREYCLHNGYSMDDVRIGRKNGLILVLVK